MFKMKIYKNEERIAMILIRGECHKYCLLSSRVYAQRFPKRNHPKPAIFERLLNQFRETGCENEKQYTSWKLKNKAFYLNGSSYSLKVLNR